MAQMLDGIDGRAMARRAEVWGQRHAPDETAQPRHARARLNLAVCVSEYRWTKSLFSEERSMVQDAAAPSVVVYSSRVGAMVYVSSREGGTELSS